MQRQLIFLFALPYSTMAHSLVTAMFACIIYDMICCIDAMAIIKCELLSKKYPLVMLRSQHTQWARGNPDTRTYFNTVFPEHNIVFFRGFDRFTSGFDIFIPGFDWFIPVSILVIGTLPLQSKCAFINKMCIFFVFWYRYILSYAWSSQFTNKWEDTSL